MSQDRKQTIAALNDRFRKEGVHSGIPGRMFATPGIAALPPSVQLDVLHSMTSFTSFTEDNDPHGEHDFGSIDSVDAGRIFWKIDYYADAKLEYGSEDPADAKRCFRVLTLMLASEY